MRRPSDIRGTASMGRALWYGGLFGGAVVGGVAGLIVALHLTRLKE